MALIFNSVFPPGYLIFPLMFTSTFYRSRSHFRKQRIFDIKTSFLLYYINVDTLPVNLYRNLYNPTISLEDAFWDV